MDYPIEFVVQDVHGVSYTAFNEESVKLNQRCTVLKGTSENGMSVLIRLFDYDSDTEAEQIRTMLAAHLKQRPCDCAETVLLRAPFAGYVTNAEGGRLLRDAVFRSSRTRSLILARVCNILEQLEQGGYVLCGGAEDSFLFTSSNEIKFCAPEALYQVGEPVFLEGPELRRPPEAFPPGYRIADACESSYYVACLVCRLLWMCSPFDSILPEEMEETEKDNDYELFEFGGDFEFVEPGLPQLFGNFELTENPVEAGMPSDTYLTEEIEQRIACGRLSWYLGVLSQKRGVSSAWKILLSMSSAELVQLVDRTFRNPSDRILRPTLCEWRSAVLSALESMIACPQCGVFFHPEAFFWENSHTSELRCVYRKCNTPMPKLYRILIYERFPGRVDEPDSAADFKLKMKRLLMTRYILAGDTLLRGVSGSLLFDDAYLGEHILLHYRWHEADGRSGVLVQLKKLEDHQEIETTFHVNDSSVEMRSEQDVRSFLLIPSVTKCISKYTLRDHANKTYDRYMTVEVSEVKQQV